MTGFNNANRKNIREAEKAAKLAESNRIAYTRTIMSSLFGREWMYNLLSRCHSFHTPFVLGAPDATAFNCGAHNIGLQLFHDVANHCPAEYTLMMQEASTKEEVHGRRYESGNESDGATSERPYGNSPESGQYGTDAEGFVTDNSGHEDIQPGDIYRN